MNLYNICVWDWTHDCDVAEEPHCYPVAAPNYEEACVVALAEHESTRDESVRKGNPYIDHQVSYEIKGAPDKEGKFRRIAFEGEPV